MTSTAFPQAQQLDRFQRFAIVAAIVGLVGCAVGAAMNPAQFLHSYLFAFLFWIGIAVGCLSLTMLQYLSGGRWGMVIRRILEAWSGTIWLGLLLFIPIALGLKHLYVWADPNAWHATKALEHAMHHKHYYLNAPFFLARGFAYLVCWTLLAWVLNSRSLRYDTEPTPQLARHQRMVSGGGLLLMSLTVTFMSFDWGMSLDPTWFSTVYGLVFFLGQGLSAFAMCIVVLATLGNTEPLVRVADRKTIHDLGKLMFACVMLWAYLNFSQFLIIWAGNQLEEIPWYLRRSRGGWQWMSLFMILFHFVFPFLLMLSRNLKRNPRLLGMIASWILFARLCDYYWYTMPEFHTQGIVPHWLDIAAPLGIGGLWLAVVAQRMKSRPLVPMGEPEIRELLARPIAPAVTGAHA